MVAAASIKPVTDLHCDIFSEVCIDSCRVLTEITTLSLEDDMQSNKND